MNMDFSNILSVLPASLERMLALDQERAHGPESAFNEQLLTRLAVAWPIWPPEV